jgi:hypothetical protein
MTVFGDFTPVAILVYSEISENTIFGANGSVYILHLRSKKKKKSLTLKTVALYRKRGLQQRSLKYKGQYKLKI